MEKYKYLPIGSVVTLKNSEEKLMIIGYQKKDQENKSYDYIACLFPIGVKSIPQQTLAFDHEEIEKIYYIGYKTKSYENLNKILEITEKLDGGTYEQ